MKVTPPPPSTFHPGRHLEVLDDPIHDPYQDRAKFSEPSTCSDCGAVFRDGRWQWLTPPLHALQVRCPACRRIHEKNPAGYVSITGDFADQHREEILNQIHHIEAREKAEHPLQRIMEIEKHPDKLMVTTTDIHLARDIGEALHHAYQGTLDYNYSDAEYLLRVTWQR